MKKKGTRKVRKNKRTTQRRKNRSYKRMRGGMIKLPWWGTPLKTNLDVNATRVISESLPILGVSSTGVTRTGVKIFVMPSGDKLTKFQGACNKFIGMMENKENFSTFYKSNKKSINTMFELLMPTDFTHLKIYEDNIIELFTLNRIPNTALGIETTLEKYIRESNTQHADSKKFNLFAFALFIMRMQQLNIFAFPLPPVSQEIIDNIYTRFDVMLKKYQDKNPKSSPHQQLDSFSRFWDIIYKSIYKHETSTLTEEGKQYIFELCGVVSKPSTSIVIQALLYYKMLPISREDFRIIYDKYINNTASDEEIRQLTLALIILVTFHQPESSGGSTGSGKLLDFSL